MGINKKYKPSPIGKIPIEWDAVLLSEICEIVRGSSPRPAGSPEFFNGDFIPWVTVSELTNLSEGQKHILKTETCLTKKGSMQSRVLEKGTLLLANSGATLGVPKILGIKACANDGVAAFINVNPEFSAEFLYYNLQGLTRYYREVVAPGNGQPNLNTTLIGETYIPKPPIKEQFKITEVLNTCDFAIEKLITLISKKERLRRSMIKDLISGEIRFKEFKNEKWKKRTIEEIAINKNSSLSLNNLEGNEGQYNLYGATGLIKKINFYESDERYIAIIKDGAGVGRSFICSERSSIVGTMAYIKQNELSDLDFLFYLLQSINFENYITGSTIPHIYFSSYSKLSLPIPSIKEQKKISSFLMNLDSEISKLKSQLDKLILQKKGLMQLLLKGKLRVKL